MKSYSRLFLAAVIMLLQSAVSDAQDLRVVLADIMQRADSSCVTITYAFATSAGDADISDEGFVEAQDQMWHLKGQALEIYTDGTSTWIMDNDTKEAIVESGWSYDDLESFYSSAKKNGTDMKLRIVSEKVSARKPTSYFTPSFDSSWIVTDLR